MGLAFLLMPAYFWWEQWRTRNWPTVEARVIEIDPQSFLEFEAGNIYLNRDSDFAIEYEVNGRKYVQTPEIENTVRVGEFKAARSPSVPRKFQIRYRQSDPNDYSIAHAHSAFTRWAIAVIGISAGVWLIFFE